MGFFLPELAAVHTQASVRELTDALSWQIWPVNLVTAARAVPVIHTINLQACHCSSLDDSNALLCMP